MKQTCSWIRGGFTAAVFVFASSLGPSSADAVAAPLYPGGLAEDTLPFAPPLEPAPIELPAFVEGARPAPPIPVDPFPARTYGNLRGAECLEILEGRGIEFTRAGHARGVETPVRLRGALHGITLRNEAADWDTSARREVLDCRLVLALDDLAALLAPHGVTEVLHLGIYRGDVPLAPHQRPLHHLAGLAIDVAAFVKDDGTRLEVRRDFHGRIGARTCASGSALPSGAAPEATELRGILCDIADGKTYHQILTPNHDVRHRDHFHLEVMRRTEWTMVD